MRICQGDYLMMKGPKYRMDQLLFVSSNLVFLGEFLAEFPVHPVRSLMSSLNSLNSLQFSSFSRVGADSLQSLHFSIASSVLHPCSSLYVRVKKMTKPCACKDDLLSVHFKDLSSCLSPPIYLNRTTSQSRTFRVVVAQNKEIRK